MTKFNPLVSIVIPVYNGANYLREAIDSALAQTYPNTEILVINDGSRDEGKTEAIALSYGDKIRYIAKENGGVATALNRGVREMKGEYFSWLSHDDVYYPHKLEVQVRFLEEQPNKEIVLYSNYDFIDKDSRFIRNAGIVPIQPRDFIRDLILGYPIHGCTALIPRLAFDKVGLFDESLRTTQDYDLWYRMAKYLDFVFVDQCLIQSRIHEEQGTVTLAATALKEVNELLTGFLEGLPESVILGFSNSKGVVDFYAEAEKSFRSRCFLEAAEYALERRELVTFRTLREAIPGVLKQYQVKKLTGLKKNAFFWLKDIETELVGLMEAHIGIVDAESWLKNEEVHESGTIRFAEADSTKDRIPTGDLVLGHDVLINSSFDDVLYWLRKIRKSRTPYLLAATYTNDATNVDKRSGQRRQINLFKYPFNLPAPQWMIADRDEPYISFALWSTRDLPYLKIRTALQLLKLRRKIRARLTRN